MIKWHKKKILRKTIQGSIVVIIFFFLFRNLYTNWASVKEYSWHFNYPLLILSFLCVVCIFLFLIMMWQLILYKLGANLKFKKAFRIWFLSALGRYIPGKVWQILGMVYLANKEGISVEKSVTSALLVQVLSIIPGMTLGIITLSFLTPSFHKWIYPSLFIIPLGIILVYPPFLEKIINFFALKLKRPKINFNAKFKEILIFISFYFLSWIFYGFAFFLFTRSVTSIPFQKALLFPGIFAGAYLIGLLTIFVPGGLGVREGILAYLLSFILPLPIATAISLASRVWLTLAELFCVGIALKIGG